MSLCSQTPCEALGLGVWYSYSSYGENYGGWGSPYVIGLRLILLLVYVASRRHMIFFHWTTCHASIVIYQERYHACVVWSADHLSRYTDSPDGDWVIGRYPGDSGLFLATSGSGHAFKVCSFTSFAYFSSPLHHAMMTGCVTTSHFPVLK